MSELWPQAEAKDMELALTKSVLIAVRVHPFPSRTRKLSSPAPTILGWRRPGKIGSADTEKRHDFGHVSFLFIPLLEVIGGGMFDC